MDTASLATCFLFGKLFSVATLFDFGEKRCRKNLPLSGTSVLNCDCEQLADFVELWDDVETFDGFAPIARNYDTELRRCPTCGCHWQIDTGRGNLAIRIIAPESWDTFDDRPVRLTHMVAHHGGHGDATCSWATCERLALNGMAICVHHAYPSLSNEVET